MICPNCNTTNLPDEANFCPECGHKIFLGTVELICKLPPLDGDITSLLPCDELPIVLGETSLSSLKGKHHFDITADGYTRWHLNSQINASKLERGNDIIDEVVIAADEFPKSWVQMGLDPKMSWNDWCKYLYKNEYDILASAMPHVQREGQHSYFYSKLYAHKGEQKYMLCLEFNAPNDRKVFSPSTLLTLTIYLNNDFFNISNHWLGKYLFVNRNSEVCISERMDISHVKIKENIISKGDNATLLWSGDHFREVEINGITYSDFNEETSVWTGGRKFSISFIPVLDQKQCIIFRGERHCDVDKYELPLEIRK